MLASADLSGLGTGLVGASLVLLATFLSLFVAFVHAVGAWSMPTTPSRKLGILWWITAGLATLGAAMMLSVGGIDSSLPPWLLPPIGTAAAMGWLVSARTPGPQGERRPSWLVLVNRCAPLGWLLVGALIAAVFAGIIHIDGFEP
ncbi:MAG: hypothetical protein K0V04_26315 [Deltaproteobacteria bacterium]|nr:hypothetical protein [Deltaproteobacteria bacterium]